MWNEWIQHDTFIPHALLIIIEARVNLKKNKTREDGLTHVFIFVHGSLFMVHDYINNLICDQRSNACYSCR